MGRTDLTWGVLTYGNTFPPSFFQAQPHSKLLPLCCCFLLTLFLCSGIGSPQAVLLSEIFALVWVFYGLQFLQEYLLCYGTLPLLTLVFTLFSTPFCSLFLWYFLPLLKYVFIFFKTEVPP